MTATTPALNEAAARSLLISRTFDVPRELVFEAWTKPQHLTQWWGPNDFTLPFCETDFRVGGRYRFCMRSPEGEDHWVWGEYREILEPERIEFSWNREDAEGKIWNSTLVKLTFTEHEGKTNFTLLQSVFENVADRDDHTGGWSQCLARLDSYLSSLRRITIMEDK